jgi:hypothetical protein
LPLAERKALLQPVVTDIRGLQFNGHEVGDGELVRHHACKLGFKGVVSKTADAPYASGNRGLGGRAVASGSAVNGQGCNSRQEKHGRPHRHAY